MKSSAFRSTACLFGRILEDCSSNSGEIWVAARDIGFRSLSESIDTTTAAGKLVFGIFGSLAEFERELIRERTRAGLVAARARGHKGGRPRVVDDKKAKAARAMRANASLSVAEICSQLKISRTSFYRYTGEASPEPERRTRATHDIVTD
jgi:DNA invertase Pin-like site-specific DNA recombinase